MSRVIDRVLLVALLVILAGIFAPSRPARDLLSLTVGAVLTASMTTIADALEHVLRVSCP